MPHDVNCRVSLGTGTLDVRQKGTACVRLPKKAIIHFAGDSAHEEPHGRPADIFEESVFGRHAECRGEAVRSLEAATSVATNAHCNGGSTAAAQAGVLSTKENMVRSAGGRARAASGTAGTEVGKDLAKATRRRGKHATNASPDSVNGAVALMAEGGGAEGITKGIKP